MDLWNQGHVIKLSTFLQRSNNVNVEIYGNFEGFLAKNSVMTSVLWSVVVPVIKEHKPCNTTGINNVVLPEAIFCYQK